MINLEILGLAFCLGLGLTPLAGRLATRLGILDHPDNALKQHQAPIPYLGGLAVYGAFMVALVVFKFWEHSTLSGVVGVVTGTSLIVILGLLDDKYQLSPAAKFAGQTLAAIILVVCNMRLHFIHNPVLSVIFSIGWVVGVTNAMNLIDIMDGLAAGVSGIACLIFLWITLETGRFNDTYIVAGLGGAVLGFLPYNFPKAKIYLGDTGALMLGFVLAAVSMGGQYSRLNPVAILTPVLILGVPIFDTLFIMFLRHRKGVSMFRGSPDHLALRLVKLGFSKKATVLILWGTTLGLGLTAYASMHLPVHWSLLLYLSVGLLALFAAERLGSFPMESRR